MVLDTPDYPKIIIGSILLRRHQNYFIWLKTLRSFSVESQWFNLIYIRISHTLYQSTSNQLTWFNQQIIRYRHRDTVSLMPKSVLQLLQLLWVMTCSIQTRPSQNNIVPAVRCSRFFSFPRCKVQARGISIWSLVMSNQERPWTVPLWKFQLTVSWYGSRMAWLNIQYVSNEFTGWWFHRLVSVWLWVWVWNHRNQVFIPQTLWHKPEFG